MPRKTASKAPKRSLQKVTDQIEKPVLTGDSGFSETSLVQPKRGPKTKIFSLVPILVILLLVVGLLGFLFKDRFIVALVNGKPIFRYDLDQRLTSTFGKETLENIIVEKLIKEEAKRKGIVIGDSDIEKEVEKIGKSLGNGMKIEDVLKIQGVSLADFKNQLKLRLQVNKILEKETTVSDEEIDKYIKDNLKVLVATGEAERKIEAKEKLVEQKIGEQIQKWVGELLSKAKITRFLK